MSTRQITIVLAFLVLIGAFAGARLISSQKKPAERTPPQSTVKSVKTRTIENGSVQVSIPVTGRLIAKQKIEVFAEVGGVLRPGAKPFKEGASFREGETLLRIEDDEFQLNMLAQKSALHNQMILLLPDLKLDYPESFEAWKAYVDQFEVKQPLKPLPAPANDQEKYFIGARNLYNLFYTIQSQESRASKYRIAAPFSGTVSESAIDPGTLVRVGQKMGEFMNSYQFELEAAVSLEDLAYFQTGAVATLRSETVPGEWKGTVARISDRIDPNTQTVRLFINTSGQGLRDGMYLVGSIAGKSIDQVVSIDRKLLLDRQSVFVVQGSVLERIQVEPVRFSTDQLLVRGIPDGTVLLDESVVGAYKGMEVKVY